MKTAVVTGGTRGIGKGVVTLLLQRGYRVITNYAGNRDAAQQALKEWKNISPFIEVVQADQSQRQDTYQFIRFIKSQTQEINCIVCNAGITVRKSFTNTSDTDWDKMMEIAVNSHCILIRELFTRIRKNSRILFTGSLMAIHPHATILGYGVSKAAVHALASNLVKEFEGSGTTVNTIAPGFVETDWQKDKPEEIRNNIYQKTAVKRFASIEEVTDAFRFCLDNGFVNGSVIEISGAYSFK